MDCARSPANFPFFSVQPDSHFNHWNQVLIGQLVHYGSSPVLIGAAKNHISVKQGVRD